MSVDERRQQGGATRDPIFKGATRPPMMLGVPIIPFILVVGFHILVGMWLLAAVGFFWLFVSLAACAIEVLALRQLSKYDDQRLDQMILRFRSIAHRRNAATWGAQSMGPSDFQKR